MKYSLKHLAKGNAINVAVIDLLTNDYLQYNVPLFSCEYQIIHNVTLIEKSLLTQEYFLHLHFRMLQPSFPILQLF